MASSRGKPAYAAIMLALTLVIMAAIVGLLILMLYLCTNIAYKFIPAKTKKNVKRMFTRKKADDEPSEPGINGARGGRARRSAIGPIGMSKEKDYAAAASGLASWHSSQDAASAALRAKHRLQRHPTAGRVNRNGRATFSPKLSGAGRGA